MYILKCAFLGACGFLLIAALLSMVILVGSLAYETLISTIEDVVSRNEKRKRRSE